MGAVLFSLQKRRVTHRILTFISKFLVDSRAVGIIVIAYAILSLTLSNLPATRGVYGSFRQHPAYLPESYLLWIINAFMAFAFFLIEKENKLKLATGEQAT